jgi:ABC-type Fe3+/spermidine/putrescine transport system ATPase subunit
LTEAIKLTVEGLTKRFGKVVAVNNISFKIYDKEFFAIIGPSGCGKTTTLRCIAGLEIPDSGSIYLDGVDVSKIAPSKRDISMVFQDLALFPHMNVFDNIAFGLRMMKYPREKVKSEVEEVMKLTRLEGLGDRRITELSGGQKHRVALARSLALKPRILLFDEPLGDIEPELRERLMVEIKELHRKLGFTALYVTHDQEQAMTLADRLMVMNRGFIEQIGTPEEVYLNPSTLFVAKFVGTTNLIRGKVEEIYEKSVKIKTDIGDFMAPLRVRVNPQTSIVYMIRPEKVFVGRKGQNCVNKINVKLKNYIYRGLDTEYVFQLPNGEEFKALIQGEKKTKIKIEEETTVGWQTEDATIILKPSVIAGLDIDRVILGE